MKSFAQKTKTLNDQKQKSAFLAKYFAHNFFLMLFL